MKCLAFGRCLDDTTANSMRDRLMKVHNSKHGPFHLAIAFASNSSIFQHIEEAYPIPLYGTSFLASTFIFIFIILSHSLSYFSNLNKHTLFLFLAHNLSHFEHLKQTQSTFSLAKRFQPTDHHHHHYNSPLRRFFLQRHLG